MEKNYKWRLLWIFLKERFSKPFHSPAYVLYFGLVIILIGSFGLIYDLLTSTYSFKLQWDHVKVKNIVMNMCNISLSLVTASIFDLIFIKKSSLKQKDDNIELYQIKRDISILGISFLIFVFALWILANTVFNNVYIKLLIGILSLTFGYYVWWISNTTNRLIIKEIDYREILGGETEFKTEDGTTKEELRGDRTGFKH